YEPKMWYYINSLEEAAFNFQFFDTDFCFVGHTHIPMVINLKEEKEISVYPHEKLNYGESEKGNRYLINTGSVGQPRDRNPDSCYAIMDTEEKSVELIRVKYNIKKVQAKMKKAKMPDFLISRLEIGR
ncbi:MAG: metallophosphoesterase family protein, partial [Chitinivibrionales bacterium]